MRAVAQRVSSARVSAGADPIFAMGEGLLVLVGVGSSDTLAEAENLARDRAKELLLSTEKNCTEICFAVGYNNQSYFTRTFKEMTGLSRKFIIPLMEFFDKTKLTIRVENHRIRREGKN